MRPDILSERALGLFAREARAGGRLTHPGIVQVHASGETDGVHWISQELVEGGWTLRDFIDDMRRAEVLPKGYYTKVAEFVAQLADALQAAHDAGVIHRDIKPQNVLIGPDDRPRVTDFGLARVADDLDLSQTGDVLGTYYYMSPEQLRGERSKLDHRSDVFGLGIVL
jgi:serine/threonine-protein kinase